LFGCPNDDEFRDQGMYLYSPYKDNTVPECKETKLFYKLGNESTEFTDWVLECKASEKPNVYYISLMSEEQHSFFVSVPMTNNTAVVTKYFYYEHLVL